MILSFAIIAAVLLTIASVLLIRKLVRIEIDKAHPDKNIFFMVLTAEILLAIFLFDSTLLESSINISIFNVFTIVSWIITGLYLSATFNKPVEVLGIFILPVTVTAIAVQLLFPHSVEVPNFTLVLEIHILLSLLAYGLLSIAVSQAIVLAIQNSFLKRKHPGGFIRSLPALQSMETLLFQIISLGFISLSLALLSGIIFLEDIFAQHLVHKTVLSIIAWGIFGTLLYGRWQFGWRGKKAINLTIGGFVFLMLAYFGSKFVLELILN